MKIDKIIEQGRMGCFSVSNLIIERETSRLGFFFKHFVIIGYEFNFTTNAHEYIAYSHLFDSARESMIVPKYTITITRIGRKRIVKAVRE